MNKKRILEEVKSTELFKRAIALVTPEERKIIEERMEAYAEFVAGNLLSSAIKARTQAQEEKTAKKADGSNDG